MPRKVKTRRQRKRASLKENVAKEEHTSHPEEKSGNLDSSVITDENLTKPNNQPPLVSPSKKDEEKLVAIASSDELVKKKAAHKRVRNPKGTRNVGELGNALDKGEGNYSSVDLVGTNNEDELLDQIWEDQDEIFPFNDEDVTKGGLAPNVDWVKQPANIESSYKLVKKKAAYHRGRTSRETHNDWNLGSGLNKDKEQYSTSDFDKILKELNELFSPIEQAVAKIAGEAITSNENLKKNTDHQCGGTPESTCDVCEFGIALDKDEEPYSKSNFLSIIDEEELDQILKDLHEIFPSSDEAAAQSGLPPEVEWEKKPGNLESTVIIDSNLANKPPLVSDKEKEEAITSIDKLKKKSAHHRNETSKGTRNTWELGNGYSSYFQEQYSSSDLLGTINKAELDQISKDLQEIHPPGDETVAKVSLYPNTNCSTPGGLVGDSGPVPPKFFGNSGYFMLTGTNSQLQQQMKDLAARNIFVESFVELPEAMADIVEQQMTDLVQNSDPILGKMREPRRVPRQKKQRKYPKKADN